MTVGTKAVAVGKALLIIGDSDERYTACEKHILVIPNLPNEAGKKQDSVYILQRYHDPKTTRNTWNTPNSLSVGSNGIPISFEELAETPDFRFEQDYLLEYGRPKGYEQEQYKFKAVDVRDLESEAEKLEALSRAVMLNLAGLMAKAEYEYEGDRWSSNITNIKTTPSMKNVAVYSVEVTDKDMSELGIYHKMPKALQTRIQNVYTHHALTK